MCSAAHTLLIAARHAAMRATETALNTATDRRAALERAHAPGHRLARARSAEHEATAVYNRAHDAWTRARRWREPRAVAVVPPEAWGPRFAIMLNLAGAGPRGGP